MNNLFSATTLLCRPTEAASSEFHVQHLMLNSVNSKCWCAMILQAPDTADLQACACEAESPISLLLGLTCPVRLLAEKSANTGKALQ